MTKKKETLKEKIEEILGDTEYLDPLDKLLSLFEKEVKEAKQRGREEERKTWFAMMEEWGWKLGGDADLTIAEFSLWIEKKLKSQK